MKQVKMTVLSNKEIANSTYEMKLFAGITADTITPGQFLHIKVGEGASHHLRRPISVADFNQHTREVTIVFKQSGEGTRKLSEVKQDETLDALFPCGTGYPMENLKEKKVLLVGGGIGVPPLYYLASTLAKKGIEVSSVLGFQTADQVFYEKEFRSYGEVMVATQDGSYGHNGMVTDIIADMEYDFDRYYSCGPTGMLKAVSSQLKDKPGYLSIEQRMGCGIGACYACVIPAPSSPSGFKKICKDGPVFPAGEVAL